jgi:hypothetical protein
MVISAVDRTPQETSLFKTCSLFISPPSLPLVFTFSVLIFAQLFLPLTIRSPLKYEYSPYFRPGGGTNEIDFKVEFNLTAMDEEGGTARSFFFVREDGPFISCSMKEGEGREMREDMSCQWAIGRPEIKFHLLKPHASLLFLSHPPKWRTEQPLVRFFFFVLFACLIPPHRSSFSPLLPPLLHISFFFPASPWG